MARQIAVDNYRAMLVEVYRKALMREHSDDWTMEVIAEAAHICARAHADLYLLPEQFRPNDGDPHG
jgi:hypothetical protein